MHIGILANIQHSVFSGGTANTSIALSELFSSLGHTTVLLNTQGSGTWWDDCKRIAASHTVQNLRELLFTPPNTPFDLLIELDTVQLKESERALLARHSVWLCRHTFLIHEMERALYPILTNDRSFKGLHEIWVFEETFSESLDLGALKLLTGGLPIKRLPYLWSPSPVKHHFEDCSGIPWMFLAKDQPWAPHILEKNCSNTSSAVLPLHILREVRRRGTVPFGRWISHNSDQTVKSQFFIDNTVKHATDLADLSGACVGRQRCAEWLHTPKSCCITHSRFVRLRAALLDLAWLGIPFLHNSDILKSVGCGLERLWYTENSIRGGANAFECMQADFQQKAGFFAPGAWTQIQRALVDRFSPASIEVRSAWADALPSFKGSTPILPKQMASPSKTTFRIGFCDMWEAFQPSYNFFLLMLSAAAKESGLTLEIQGVDATKDSSIDLCIFGPFGTTWRTLPSSIPKVHFTGENTDPIDAADVKLNLGFQHKDILTDSYLRFPLWITYIDWFKADLDRLVNPKPFPLDMATKVRAADLAQKKKFCAFVVSNPSNELRNKAFEWLNRYKPVDSAGRLFNTTGDALFALGGGGGGELKKLEFLKDYKFCIAFENSSSRGYTTEKYLHAKAAGCIPIYWGDPVIEREFDLAGAIDARRFKTAEELIEAVKKVDTDDSAWLKQYAVPALDDYRVQWCRRTMAELARRLFGLAGVKVPETFPRFLTATAGPLPTTTVLSSVASQPVVVSATPELPIVVTCATARFLPSLQHWLMAYKSQLGALPELRGLVFLGRDVPEDSKAVLQTEFSFVRFETLPETIVPEGFADFWNFEHYGWKLWIFNSLTHRPELQGRMILYTDAGSFLCRWPKAWMLKAQQQGVCLLEDPREENARWCSKAFCAELQVSEAELAKQQRLGGLVCFRAGSTQANCLFSEAYRLAQNRVVLCGAKWDGVLPSGKPHGHRHDQSILSLLSLRQGVAVEPLDTVYCDTSLRKTFTSGKCIYVHRGNFTVHNPVLPEIDEAFVINLERRSDRLIRFRENHPNFHTRVERWPAVEGRSLQLTPALARLFRPQDFFWKKAVMGCALSHLGLWYKLAHEPPDLKNYLILEDDVKFRPGWEEIWREAAPHIPEDYDILYLGGILPPNRTGYESVAKERVNPYFCKIRENRCFGQAIPNRYFHFCAYSYILSRTGAQKVLGLLKQMNGFWTSADHVLCNPIDTLTSYILDPILAGCYQDDDPNYAQSEFNNFSRIDSFDSDLWNNDERFTGAEVAAANAPETLDIGAALLEAAAQKGAPMGCEVNEIIGSCPKTSLDLPLTNLFPHRILSAPGHTLALKELYEYSYLLELFKQPVGLEVVQGSATGPIPTDCPIVVFQRPFIDAATEMVRRWDAAGARFKILHLSDEFLKDDLSAYELSGCVGVVRTYLRPVTPSIEKKILTIPLGYHVSPGRNPLLETPHLPFRQQVWSFFGTGWQGRQEKLLPLMLKKLPNQTKIFSNWNDPEAAGKEEYIGTMLDSLFIPCPDGMNPETYRIYESLECGAVPLVVATPENSAFLSWLTGHVLLLPVKTWEQAAELMEFLVKNPQQLEVYREKQISSWIRWKEQLVEEVQAWLALS
jgi:GR25 family glycosyltransferase involved in LPS biosynthesis